MPRKEALGRLTRNHHGMGDEQLMRQIEEFQRCIAARDVRGAEAVLDDDYALMLVHPARAVMPRGRWLEVLPDDLVPPYEVHERVVDRDGDCATVLHRVEMTATVLDEDRSGLFVITDVCGGVRRDGVLVAALDATRSWSDARGGRIARFETASSRGRFRCQGRRSNPSGMRG